MQPPEIRIRALRPEELLSARLAAQALQNVGVKMGDLGMVRHGRALAQLVKEAQQPSLPPPPNPSR